MAKASAHPSASPLLRSSFNDVNQDREGSGKVTKTGILGQFSKHVKFES